MSDIRRLVDEILEAHKSREKLKLAIGEVDARIAELDDKLAEAMISSGENQLNHAGMWITRKERTSWSFLKEGQEAALALCEVHAPDAVKKTVHPATLTKMVESGESWTAELKPMLSAKVSVSVSVTKTRPKV